MKKRVLNNSFLLGLVLGFCVLSYLALSAAGPVLHNHHDGKEHHHDCPVCRFLDVAAFFDIQEGEPVVVFLVLSEEAVCLSDQTFPFIFYDRSFLGRAPPGISTV
ncbi:MAG: hypothetical protein ABH883_06770 [Candidatus Omnitrophota bacterium]